MLTVIRICILCMLLCGLGGSIHAAELRGETSQTLLNMFVPGEEVKLSFHAAKLPEQDLTLDLNIVDMNEQSVRRFTLPVKADNEKRWNGTVIAPGECLGFYRVYAKLSDGTTIGKTGSRPAGYITYAVVPNPETRKRYAMDETFFGIVGSTDGKAGTRAFLPYLGASWNAGTGKVYGHHSTWRLLEPSCPGEFTKKSKSGTKIEYRLPKIKYGKHNREWGLFSYYSIGLPHWNKVNLDSYFKYDPEVNNPKRFIPAPLSELGEKEFVRFMKELCQEVSKHSPENEFNLYQVSWEPHYPWHFQGRQEDLVRIHELAYKVIHESDPRGRLIGPAAAGLASAYISWHRELFRKGLGKYLDGLSIHPYLKKYPMEPEGIVSKIRDLKMIIRKSCGRDLPIYGTEFGYRTDEKKEKERTQALAHVRGNLIFLGEGFKANLSFMGADYPSEPGYGIFYNLDDMKKRIWNAKHIGPKPAAAAYAAMSYFLEGHVSAGPIDWLEGDSMGYVYQRKDHVVLSLWNYGKGAAVELLTGCETTEIADLMGNRTIKKTPGGHLKLKLTDEPVYVIGVSPRLWGTKAVKSIHPKPKNISAVAGSIVFIKGMLKANDQVLDGALRLEESEALGIGSDSVAVHLKPGEETKFEFRGTISPDAALGRTQVKISYYENGEIRMREPLTVTVQPPLRLDSAKPIFSNNNFGVALKLSDLAGTSAKGEVRLRLKGVPESTRTAPFAFSAGASSFVEIPLKGVIANSLKAYELICRSVSENGFTYKLTERINFFRVPFNKRIIVDGSLDDWQGIKRCPVIGKEYLKQDGGYRGTDDIKADVAAAWNHNNLFLSFQVDDDRFFQPFTGIRTWDGDSIQIGLAHVDVEESANALAEKMNLSYSELDFALTKNGPEVYRTITFDNQRFPKGLLAGKDVVLNVVKENKGKGHCRIIYEIAIPWRLLDFTPEEGGRIGIGFTVNDRDQSLDKQKNASRIGAFDLKDPFLFGTLVLY